MAVVLTANNAPYDLDMTQTRIFMYGTVTFSGSYTTGGILPVYQPIANAAGQNVLVATLNTNPDELWIYSYGGSGYTYSYNKATGKIQVFVTGTASGDPLNELASGSMAGVIADVIHFEAEWVKQ
jgi:hypothetical protein